MKKINKVYLARGLVILIFFVAFYVLNTMTLLVADDYSYAYSFKTGERIESIKDILLSQQAHYYSMNGRSVVHFLAQFFLLLGKPIFNVINTFAFMGLCLLICYLSFGSLKKIRFSWFVISYVGLWIMTPAYGDSYLWLTGAANYLYGILLASLYLIPFRKVSTNTSESPKKTNIPKEILFSVLFLIAGVIAGWTNENIGPAVCGMVVLFLILYKFSHISWKPWMFTGLAGNIIGSLFMLLSPAQSKRAESLGGFGDLKTWLRRAVTITYDALNYLLPVIVLWVVFFVIFCYQNQELKWKEKLIKAGPSIILLCGTIASAYAMMITPYFPERAWSGIIVLALISTGMMFAIVQIDTTVLKRILLSISITAFCFFCLTYGEAFLDVRSVSRQAHQRVDYIMSEKEKGNLDVTLSPISRKSKFDAYPEEGDLTYDVSHWRNNQIAQYYGLNSVNRK